MRAITINGQVWHVSEYGISHQLPGGVGGQAVLFLSLATGEQRIGSVNVLDLKQASDDDLLGAFKESKAV